VKAKEKFFVLLAVVDGDSWEPADIAALIGSTPDYARKLMADLRQSCRKNKNFPRFGKNVSSVNC